jgi:hypothetical protein
MTALDDARAALVDTPLNENRFADALEALIAEHERLTADDEFEAITDKALWDFADDLLDAWNIEDENPPGLSEMFRDRFVARFRRQGPITDEQVDAAIQTWRSHVWDPTTRLCTCGEYFEAIGRERNGHPEHAMRAALEAARAVS